MTPRYDSPEEVVQEFYTIRLEHYEKRRTFLLKAAEAELVKLDNKVMGTKGCLHVSTLRLLLGSSCLSAFSC